jgi:outer membrane protein
MKMRYVLPALVLLSSTAAVAGAAELKIGFIDSEKIFAEYQATSVAQAEFEADIQQWNQELETRKRELEKMTEDFESQRLILSQQKQQEMEEQLQTKRTELDAFVQEIWGPAGKVAQRNEQLTRPIVEKIREVLNEIGNQEGFSIIFDAIDGNVVYADQALDLTDRVIARLNEQRPVGQN